MRTLPILTNFGLSCASALNGNPALGRFHNPATLPTLVALRDGSALPSDHADSVQLLQRQGLVELVDIGTSQAEIQLRYKRNPLEHIRQAVFEYTSRCNFNCPMCYNARITPMTETNFRRLEQVAGTLVMMGIKTFAFIGGEVSKFGTNWLDLARYIKPRGDFEIGLVTNGWFTLREGAFTAAGIRYISRADYFAELKRAGVTHILFSLDGPREVHDVSRGRKGLYDGILRAFEEVRAAGMEARVSLLIEEENDPLHFAALAEHLYTFSDRDGARKRGLRLLSDPVNILSHRIDIGNDASPEGGNFSLDGSIDQLRCKGFFRPTDVTIKANGEVSTCRLVNIGEGYGNIHERSLREILNGMQESFVFQLHAENRLWEYAPFVDPVIFGSSFRHLCTLRSIVTAVAKEVHENKVSIDDRKAVLDINRRIARLTGHLQ